LCSPQAYAAGGAHRKSNPCLCLRFTIVTIASTCTWPSYRMESLDITHAKKVITGELLPSTQTVDGSIRDTDCQGVQGQHKSRTTSPNGHHLTQRTPTSSQDMYMRGGMPGYATGMVLRDMK